jgi:fructose/tagatose bisphosphate aldolase
MYVTSKEMLTEAQKGGYAVGAFNAENMEMIRAIIAAAEELKAPVMIQTLSFNRLCILPQYHTTIYNQSMACYP